VNTSLLDDKSLADPDVQERPEAYYHALHERPIFYDARLGFYICSRYRTMREILRNTEVFSSVDSQSMDSLRPPPPEVVAPEMPPPAAAPPLDLEGLEYRLKQTKALGVLTKLALKNQIDDLIADLDAFHQKHEGDLAALRERFDLLLLKVTSLLQDGEPDLAREIAEARDGLWRLLADPTEFAKLSA